MTDLHAANSELLHGRVQPGLKHLRAALRPLLYVLVAFWIFSGSIVLFEPSPYELLFLLVLPLGIVAGVGVHRGTFNFFAIIILFVPFALIAAMGVRHGEPLDAFLYTAVTIFLLLTGYFVANFVADAPLVHMRLIVKAYIAAAVFSALIGLFAYLGILPGEELFTLYGRAKAMFEDPNVFGPFLVLPAAFALQRVLLGQTRKALWGALWFGILFLGVFVSFSRGAWGALALASFMTFVLCFALEANARQKVRMLILMLVGLGSMIIMLAGLLSIPEVNELFQERASLTQSYDTGETGRFGRQKYAFDLALQHPWGLGPLQFRNMRIVEEPHNTYLSVIHSYGWGGGLLFWGLTIMTFWRGLTALGMNSPNRLLIIPLFATYVPLALQAALIDTDHWRHYFLVMGLIWGVTASYGVLTKRQKSERRAGII